MTQISSALNITCADRKAVGGSQKFWIAPVTASGVSFTISGGAVSAFSGVTAYEIQTEDHKIEWTFAYEKGEGQNLVRTDTINVPVPNLTQENFDFIESLEDGCDYIGILKDNGDGAASSARKWLFGYNEKQRLKFIGVEGQAGIELSDMKGVTLQFQCVSSKVTPYQYTGSDPS